MESPAVSHERSLSLRENAYGFRGRPPYSTARESNTNQAAPSSTTPNLNSEIQQVNPPHSALPSTSLPDQRASHSPETRTPHSRHSQLDHTWSISTTGVRSRRSLDPNVRPASMRGDDSDKPWIATFRDLEDPGAEVPPTPTQLGTSQGHIGGNIVTDSTRDVDKDVEKGSPSDSSFEDEKSKGQQQQEQQSKDPNLIELDGPHDPLNPQNWTTKKKWIFTFTYGMLTFSVTFASAVFSTAIVPTSKEFGVSEEVMTLGTSLFVLGFAWGPPIWGPFSELYGRKLPLYIGYIIFGIFNIPVAVAQNLQTIFVCRFFSGLFASAPLAVVGGALADLWDPVRRGYALCVFSAATFIGPAMAPIVGSFTVESYLGWRWTAWLTAIISLSIGVTTVWIIPETFVPRILQIKAKNLRYESKNWAIHAKLDEQRISPKDIAVRYLYRPFVMLALEPILALITLYMSLIYGIIYLFFEAFPIAFQELRGLSPGVASLPFISLLVGVIFGATIICLITKYRFAPKMHREGRVAPEERLVPMFVGGALLPVGLFWFAWTSNSHISIWPQIISIVFAGAGIMMIFLQGLAYLIDVYLMNANSAIAANSFVRSWVAGGFIMFATGMFHDLGVPWAASLLGFLCLALYPAPIVFFIMGSKIRGWSRFSPTLN